MHTGELLCVNQTTVESKADVVLSFCFWMAFLKEEGCCYKTDIKHAMGLGRILRQKLCCCLVLCGGCNLVLTLR